MTNRGTLDLALQGTTDLPNGLALGGLQVATDTAAGWRCANLPAQAKAAKTGFIAIDGGTPGKESQDVDGVFLEQSQYIGRGFNLLLRCDDLCRTFVTASAR
jgi:hypothetical protein